MSLVERDDGYRSARQIDDIVAELQQLVAAADGDGARRARQEKGGRIPRVRAYVRALIANDSLVRGSVGLMTSTVLTSVFGYLYWIVAAHGYHTADVGVAGALISAVTIVSILGNFGLGSSLIQRLPVARDDATWSTTLNTCLLAGAIAGGLMGAGAALLLPNTAHTFAALDSPSVAALFIAACASWTAASVLDCVFIAERSSSGLVVRNTFGSLLRIPLLFLPLFLGARSEASLFASWTVAAVLALALGVFILVRRIKPGYRVRARGSFNELRDIRRSLVGHHLTTIGSILPTWLLPVVVALRLSATESAYFFITWMVCALFFMVSPSVSNAVFAEGSHNPSAVRDAARRSARLIGLLLVFPMAVYLAAGHLILRVFGPAYPAAGYGLLVVLVLSAVPDAVTNVAVAIYRVEGRLRQAAGLNLAMSAMTLAIAWVLLPHVGIVGAGLGWLIAQSAGALFVLADVCIRRPNTRSAEVGTCV
jgi:O-antigen/teichoic acid export membrane protein